MRFAFQVSKGSIGDCSTGNRATIRMIPSGVTSTAPTVTSAARAAFTALTTSACRKVEGRRGITQNAPFTRTRATPDGFAAARTATPILIFPAAVVVTIPGESSQ